jgi:hypothetical protein
VVADILNGTIPAHPVCLGTGNFASGSAAQSATVNFPKFYKPGDRLGLSYNGVGNTAPSFVANDPGDTGTGFVEVANSPQKDPSSALNARLHVYTFVVPAGRGSDAPNTPLNAVTFNNPAGDDSWIVECTNFGPCEVEATFGSATNTNSTSVLMPAGSTSGDNRLIAQYISHKPSAAITATPPGQVTSWANSDLTKIEEQYDVATTLGTDHGAALMTGVKATEGDFQASTATLVTSATQARLVVVLRKAA